MSISTPVSVSTGMPAEVFPVAPVGPVDQTTYEEALSQLRELIAAPDAGPVEHDGIPPLDMEWCELCAHDEDGEAGMPQTVVSRSVEEDPLWGTDFPPAPHYTVTYLSCGHTLSRLC